MIIVVAALACRGYGRRDDGTYDVMGAGLDGLVPEEYPLLGQDLLPVVATLMKDDETPWSPEDVATVIAELVDPSGTKVSDVCADVSMEPSEGPQPLIQMLGLALPLIARGPGLHHVAVSVAGSPDALLLPLQLLPPQPGG